MSFKKKNEEKYFGRIFSGRKKKKLTKLLGDQEREIDVKSIKKSRKAEREGEIIYNLKGEDDGEGKSLSKDADEDVPEIVFQKLVAENSTG